MSRRAMKMIYNIVVVAPPKGSEEPQKPQTEEKTKKTAKKSTKK